MDTKCRGEAIRQFGYACERLARPVRRGGFPDKERKRFRNFALTSDPFFFFTAFLAVSALGLAKGGFSGIGMAATPLLALTMPPLQALAILLCRS